MKRYFKHNIVYIGLRILWLLLTGNKQTWRKVKGIFKKGTNFIVVNTLIDQIPIEKRGDLLSICILPYCRGNGMAQDLITEYQTILEKRNRKLCLLTVDIMNGRGLRFYERNGFIPYKEAEGIIRTYAKILNRYEEDLK